jgi:hypothetical protein
MTCYIELGHFSASGFPARGPEPIELFSAAFPVKLSGSHDSMIVSSDEPGWIHVSMEDTDKAAIGKSRRILPGVLRSLSGVGGGMYVSFIADSQTHVFEQKTSVEEPANIEDKTEAPAKPKRTRARKKPSA